MWSQKYAKNCCHKTTWAIIIMTPHHLLEASEIRDTEASPSKHFIHFDKSGGYEQLDLCSKRVEINSNSAKLSQCPPELDLSLFCNILREWTELDLSLFLRHPEGVDLTVTEHFS